MNTTTRILFLGGAAEIGRNMMVIDHDDGIIVVDCGVGFPTDDQPGVDLVLPNIDWLRARRDRILGIIVTHGHEDHIGALPFLLPDLRCPLYATRLTLGLVAGKLTEVGYLEQAKLHEIKPGADQIFELGPFLIEPFRVTHSIPDCVGFAISTPSGLIVHTGDFKIDATPIDNQHFDLDALQRYGDQGVRLLVSDCTHIEAAGHTLSERVLAESYDEIFAAATGRIVIATFASLIARIQQVIETAGRHNRRVAILGRSMVKNAEIALELGYLTDPNRVLIDAKDAQSVEPGRIVYIVTGSQGEPMSVLSRIANGDHKEIKVGEGDTVIVAATPIPGNETAVYKIIDSLFRQGADVLYSARARVHVSGHGSRDEISKVIELTRPQHVMPFHGEQRMLALYADLALEHGMGSDRFTRVEVGDIVEVTPDSVQIVEHISATPVYVDGGSVGEIGEVVLRDRQVLADDGIVLAVVAVDRETGAIVAGPELVTRGFVHAGESAELLESAKQRIVDVLGNYTGDHHSEDGQYLSRQLRNATQQYLQKETGRRPMVLPMVMEV
ncbi:MAG: ribonuclease J [Thermomicrobiales bacterium]|nr:ribonuclease J [Thermomicrobiales bacterium]